MPRPLCIFCERAATTGEHFWPKWMRPLLRGHSFTHSIESSLDASQKGSPFAENTRRTRQGSPEHTKFKVVCSTCNNGWMNAVEKANRHYLTPLVKGERATLTAITRRSIAEWIYLKTLVLSHAPTPASNPTPHVIYARREAFAFKVWRRIPIDFRVWLAHGDLDQWRVGVRLNSGRLHSALLSPDQDFMARLQRNIQMVIWGAGHLVIQTFGKTNPDINFAPTPLFGGILLWPIESQDTVDIAWPPARALHDQDLWDIAQLSSEQLRRIHQHSR